MKTCDNYWGLWCYIYSNLNVQSYVEEEARKSLLIVRNFVELFLIGTWQMKVWTNKLQLGIDMFFFVSPIKFILIRNWVQKNKKTIILNTKW